MRPGFKWWVAGLVTVAVFAAVTWLFADVLAPLWVHDDRNQQLGWGFGAGTAAAALAALWGKSYAGAGRGTAQGGQVVEGSAVGGGIAQVSGAGSVKITRRDVPPVPQQASPAQPAGTPPAAEAPDGGGQRVSGTTAAGPLDQVQGVEGDVEIEQ